MENGNEKPNSGLTNEAGLNGSKHQETWRIVCGSDQRFFFVNSENDDSQWIPPADLWSSKLGLPYGWEAGISGNNIKYYINHVEKTTTLEDPRSEADQAIQLRMAAQRSRKVQINRDPAMGFGFVAGSEKPVVIRSVIPDGPSNGKLYSNDQILRVNGEDVSDVPQERVINLIKSCIDSLEMDVVSSEDLQDAKNQGQRRSSLMSRATRERRRSSPVNVRFADDIVQYIGPAEQARRSSLPVIPNVLKVYLENGQTRSFHYSQKTTVQEIFTSLGQKIGIKSMQYFSLVLSGPQKNQMSLIQNHEKVADVYLNRNCSRSSWVCKLRLCFLPRNPIDLFDEDPIVFNYLYDQISKDIVEGHYGSDLRYDLAIKLAALHMQQKAIHSKNKMPTKLSVKMIEKEFDGLDHFIPEDIIRGVKMKDLRKVLDQQIKFNQSLATIGQRYLSSAECKKQYLKEAKDLMSYGGKYFKVILYSYDQLTNGTSKNDSKKPNQQDATLLVSPRYGLSQMVKGEVNVLCQVADLEQITEFAIAYHTEGKRLLTISSKESKDTILVMKPLDSMDLVTFIIGYQKLWNKPTAKLKIMGDTQEPLAPLTDGDIPPYASTHRIVPDSWSYPSFLQVPGNNSNHNFFVDLSKPPAVNGKQNGEDENTSPLKRSSEDLTASESTACSDVPEKRAKNEDSISVGSSNNDEQSRALYAITEEGYLSNNDEDNDLITQLTFAEEMYQGDHTTSKAPSQSSEPENKADSDSSIEKNDKIGSELDEKEVDSNKMAVDHNDIDILGTELLLEDEDRNGLEISNEFKEVQNANKDKASNAEMLVNADDDQFEQPIKDDFLDINDIDIDDRGSDGPASDDMHSSLADFSFAGEMFTPDLRSSTESLTMDDDIVSSVAMRKKTTDDPGESEKISVDHDRSQSPRSNDVDIPTSGGTTLNPVTSNDITIENKKYFSKRLHVDELDCKLEHGKVEHDKMDGKQQKMVVYDIDLDDTDYNEDEETGIKLLSFTQFDDTESKETNSEQGEDSKDSDISSLTSRESTTADSHEDDKEDPCSNEQMDGNEKQNSRTEMSEFSSTNTSKVVASTVNQESENSKGLDQIDGASIPDNSEHITDNHSNVMLDLSVTDSEWPRISSKSSSSDTLILGTEPGESDDTPFVIAEGSSSQEVAFANDQDISLMDWIIPPPPGSTRELQESDITVASPPPLSPDPISSPPVELSGFDELEIDGLVVPPPPLGPSLDELIKIVSPPPHKQTTFNTIWDGPVIQSNVTKEMDTTAKELKRLSLNDGQQNDLTFPDRNFRRRIHSSESSGSQAFDFDSDSANYYSESMVSCYSLSNDSQRTSEDELFEETKVVLSEKVEKPFMQTVIGDLQDSRPGITEDEKRIDESKVGNKGKLSNQSLIDRTLIQRPERKPVTSQDDILSLYTSQQATHLTNGLPFDDYDCFDDVVVNYDSFPHSVTRKDDAVHTKGVNTKQIESKEEHIQESGNNLQQSIPAAKPKLSNPTMNVILADQEYSDKDNDSVTSSTFPDYLLQQSDTVVKITPNYHDDNESVDKLRQTPSKKPLSCNPTLRVVLQEEGSSDNESLVSTGFPGYLLQQSNEKALEKRDSAPRSDSSSIEFETESRNDKDVTSVPTKTATKRNAKLNMDNDDLGEDDRSDNTSPKSHKSKLETKDLTERLKLRIQGCVEDCKQAVIKSSYSYSNNSKWKEAVQENASSFASDIRQLNLNVQEMNPNIQPSVKSSQETLQSLVGSFVMASSTKSRISIYSIRILAGILNDVICLYDDIIDKTEEAVRLFPAREKCKDVSEKTSAMNTLIGSLGRTLKRL